MQNENTIESTSEVDFAVMSDRPRMLLSCSLSSIKPSRRGNGSKSAWMMRRS